MLLHVIKELWIFISNQNVINTTVGVLTLLQVNKWLLWIWRRIKPILCNIWYCLKIKKSKDQLVNDIKEVQKTSDKYDSLKSVDFNKSIKFCEEFLTYLKQCRFIVVYEKIVGCIPQSIIYMEDTFFSHSILITNGDRIHEAHGKAIDRYINSLLHSACLKILYRAGYIENVRDLNTLYQIKIPEGYYIDKFYILTEKGKLFYSKFS